MAQQPPKSPNDFDGPDLSSLFGNEPAPTVEPSFTATDLSRKIVPPQFRGLDPIKQFSERATLTNANVPLSFPFSILLTGSIDESARTILKEILSDPEIGINPTDLQRQFDQGRVLVPRISETLAVEIVHLFRGTDIGIRMGPSESVFSSTDSLEETRDPLPLEQLSEQNRGVEFADEESLPILTTDLPANSRAEVLDSLIASATLRSSQVEIRSSREYQEMLDALRRELRYKAHRRGATKIVSFQISLTQLKDAASYRMVAIGTAVRESI